ncbi:MAG: hypothetical protein K6T90_16200 [Leptolyngbyaceae cyanobacterium HOT.MB2.61]|jgi:hypothetical protein|nr:hypothetical protein [Leptolyngbyaceae cyanobacterium HOT.MB2.61]
MQEPRFFRFIKSANALIFFGVGLLLLGVLGYTAYQIYRETLRDRTASGVVNIASPNQNTKTQMSLGTFASIEGTFYYLAPINVEQEYRQGYYDKATSSTRNYLILNTADKSAVRLVPRNDLLFVHVEKLGQKDKAGKLIKAEGLMYEVVKVDSNGDDRLTETDQKAIALSEVSGKNYTELLPNVDRVLGKVQIAPAKVMLIYTIGNQNFVAEIDVTARQVVSAQKLPAIE